MNDPALFYTIVFGIILCAVGHFCVRQFFAYRVSKSEFPENWRSIIQQRIPIYQKLAPNLQYQLEQLVKMFIHEKRFISCGGLVIDDEVRVTVAASACLLLLNREAPNYPKLQWIYIYPAEFIVRFPSQYEHGVPPGVDVSAFGESWLNAKIVLSWCSTTHCVFGFGEFSGARGVTGRTQASAYKCWSRLLASNEDEGGTEITRLEVFDEEASASPIESFATATENFYESPKKLADSHPELFAQLKAHYNVDPREWLA